ncbi:MAG: hypothetical protein CMJ26_07515 [Phycisphaerae bacterium]|nr:hypothetical protein [Phycisphaerae bacterium]
MKETVVSSLVVRTMEKQRTIIGEWLQNKCQLEKETLLSELGQKMHKSNDMPVEGMIEQLAAGLMVACADELGLSPMELTGLLRSPRKDALAGLVTVLHTDA